MEKKEQKKRIAANTLYTMGGLIFMNGVLQLIITPLLNRYMGAKQLGELLYITGLVAIICPSVGQALNTSRLVVRRSYEVTNGDYDWILLLFGILGSGVALFMSRDSISGIPVGIGVFALFLLTVFRYYGDVEYRLNLNYQRYFIYYLLIGIGYLAGFVIYRITDQWLWIYLVGEVAALCYVAVTGSVFHKFFRRSGHFFVALERGFFLTLSYLITNTTMNMDRLVIKQILEKKKRKHQRLYGFLQSSVLLQLLQQQYMVFIASLHQIIWKTLKTILKMIMMTISSKMKRTKKSQQNQQRKKKKNKNNLEGCGCSPFFLCNR